QKLCKITGIVGVGERAGRRGTELTQEWDRSGNHPRDVMRSECDHRILYGVLRLAHFFIAFPGDDFRVFLIQSDAHRFIFIKRHRIRICEFEGGDIFTALRTSDCTLADTFYPGLWVFRPAVRTDAGDERVAVEAPLYWFIVAGSGSC